ncbi:MAG: thiamine pyrophosphate-binding protein [Actinomycetia bacterium]|nr:thiamine pyrophosphate-binding protein [Actinomycetes bacterium]
MFTECGGIQLAGERLKRAKTIKKEGSIKAAVGAGSLRQFEDITVSEALVLGLLNQEVTKYIGIFGHGSTDIGEVLRIYEDAGLIKMFHVRHETEAAHIATMLRWQYNEVAAVITSIGPGAMHAFAGSLASASNGIGVYHIYADETTHDEGPNFQQIPKHEQGLYLKLTSTMGKSYVLHTPEAIFSALRRGCTTVYNPGFASPFYFLMPMNIQPAVIKNCNLMELPEKTIINPVVCESTGPFEEAYELIRNSNKIVIKAGGGAAGAGREIKILADLIDAVVVNSPQVSGLLPYNEKRNMTVGGSKGSISGNHAMNEADLVIVIGARGVCQWDCSGTAWKKAKGFINFNTDIYDAAHYNNTVSVLGDAKGNLARLINFLKEKKFGSKKENISDWLRINVEKKKEWDAYKQKRYDNPLIYDKRWGRKVLSQPAALKIASDFASKMNAVKYFDSGDVQANGFQAIEDSAYGQTYNDVGSSYMGLGISALLGNAIADKDVYAIAFSGDGSFTMNPQILFDGAEHGLRAMIIIFDNRAMGAISSLQKAQYKREFKTSDNIDIDYAALANSINGVKGMHGGFSPQEFKNTLEEGYNYSGLSVIHLPVYHGDDELGGLGVYGDWNMGNWCKRVQELHHKLGH